MTNALPVWHCLNREVQERLRLSLPKKWRPPDFEWLPWGKEVVRINIESLKEISREMAKAPSRSRK